MGTAAEIKTDPVVLDATLEQLRGIFGDKTMLTVEETARALGLKTEAVYHYLRRRSKHDFPIKPKRIGRQVRFSTVAVAKFMAEGV